LACFDSILLRRPFGCARALACGAALAALSCGGAGAKYGAAPAAADGGGRNAAGDSGAGAGASGHDPIAGGAGLGSAGTAGRGDGGRGSSGSGARRGSAGTGGTGGRGSAGAAAISGGAGAGAGNAGAAGSAGTGSIGAQTKFVGNITTNGAVRDGFVQYWNQITPENEGKWGSVESTQGNFNWTALDKIYAYAQTNHLVFKQHNFIWGSQQPSWLNSSNAQAAVQAWMQAFCARYPDTQLIDVVNEPPPHTMPSYLDGIGGAGTSGYDWIVNAFKWARAACPNAILILNDYNTIEYATDNSHFIDIVTKIKAAGAPIDAIGAQAHDAYKIPTDTVRGFIDKLAGTGLPIYISEYDIPIADDDQQKQIMSEQITMYWNDSHVQGITLWGYIVGSTWKTNTGLQQTDGTLRPAMSWLMTFLGR
jgi:endo-1,4-beta-xylanase